MSNTVVRRTIVAVIGLLLANQLAAWLAHVLGPIGGVLSAIVVAGVLYFGTRRARAGKGNAAWFLVPTLLLTFLPLILQISKFFTEEKPLYQRILGQLPFLVGFLAPVLLLIAVYLGLRRRSEESS